MKPIKIFEPAMCCPERLRISTVLNTRKQNGAEVQRFNLTSALLQAKARKKRIDPHTGIHFALIAWNYKRKHL